MEASDPAPSAPASTSSVAPSQGPSTNLPASATSPARPHRPQLRYSYRGGPRRPFHPQRGGFRGSFRGGGGHNHGPSHYGPGPGAAGPPGAPGMPSMLLPGGPRGGPPPRHLMMQPPPGPMPVSMGVPVVMQPPINMVPINLQQIPPRMAPMQMQMQMGMPPRQPMMMAIQPQQVQQQPLPVAATVLPAGWSEHIAPDTGLKYYYNATTGVSTYDPPSAAATASTATMNGVAENGFAQDPGASQNQQSAWIEYKDDASGKPYYYNTLTKACVWDMPEEFRVQQARAQVEKLQEEQAKELSSIEADAQHRTSDEGDGQADADASKANGSPEKKHTNAKSKKQQEEEALEASFKAMSRAERVQVFKCFLKDKGISPQLKWADAQKVFVKDGLVNDVRWRVLSTNGERKQSFAEYCTQVVNQEAVERRRQVKRQREEFGELLAAFKHEIGVHTKFKDLQTELQFIALRKDPRFVRLSDAPKDQEELFVQFQKAQEREREREQHELRESLRTSIQQLLYRHQIQFQGHRRLDSSVKKLFWKLVEEQEDDKWKQQIQQLQKHVLYDWLEDFMDELRAKEQLERKSERERTKEEQVKWAHWLQNTFESCFVLASYKDVESELLNKLEQLPAEEEDKKQTQKELLQQWKQLDHKKQRRFYEKWVTRSIHELKKPRELMRALLPDDFDMLRVAQLDQFVQELRERVKKLKLNVEDWLRFQHEQMALSDLFSELDESLSHFANDANDKPEEGEEAEDGEEPAEDDASARELPGFVRRVFDFLLWRAKKRQQHKRPATSSIDSSGKHGNDYNYDHNHGHDDSHDHNDNDHARASSRKRRRRSSRSHSRSLSRSKSRSRSKSKSRSRSRSKSRSHSRSRSATRTIQDLTAPMAPMDSFIDKTNAPSVVSVAPPVAYVPCVVDDDDELEDGEVVEE